MPSLIIASYNAEAAIDKRVASPARQAVLKITGYSERNTAARILVGVFAGKDEGDVIAALIDLEDAEINAVGDCMSGCCMVQPKFEDFVRTGK